MLKPHGNGSLPAQILTAMRAASWECSCSSPEQPMYAFVNGLCAAAGTEQSEFRLLHSSCYWPTSSLIIPANIDTACVVSHLYPPLPLPSLAERGKAAEWHRRVIEESMEDQEPNKTNKCGFSVYLKFPGDFPHLSPHCCISRVNKRKSSHKKTRMNDPWDTPLHIFQALSQI